MTDGQVNLVVQHLCEQLHLALRLKGSEAHPPNAKDIGFKLASVRTVLLTGLRSAGCHDPPRGGRGERRAAVVLNAKPPPPANFSVRSFASVLPDHGDFRSAPGERTFSG